MEVTSVETQNITLSLPKDILQHHPEDLNLGQIYDKVTVHNPIVNGDR